MRMYFLLLLNKLCSLKLHLLVVSWLCVRNADSAGFSAQGLSKLRSTCWPALLLSGGSWEESAFKLIQVAGRIQLFAVVEPRSPFRCWL